MNIKRQHTQTANDQTFKSKRTVNLIDALERKALLSLVVEPAGSCNLTCSFCDLHSGRLQDVEQYKGIMTFKIFKTLVDQLSRQHFKLKEMQLHGNGEPLLNKQLEKFVSYAKEKNVAERIRITTNGTMLTEKRFVGLVAAGADEIRISADVADIDAYEKFKGKNLFKKLDKNIKFSIDYVNKNENISLVIKYPVTNDQSSTQYGVDDTFEKSIHEQYASRITSSKILLSAMPVQTQMDGVILYKKKVSKPCELPFYSLFVKFDGRVSACCADVTNVFNFGNILDGEKEFENILHGEELRGLRRKHIQKNLQDVPICNFCSVRTVTDMEGHADEILLLI